MNLMTVPQASKVLGLSTNAIYGMMEANILTTYREKGGGDEHVKGAHRNQMLVDVDEWEQHPEVKAEAEVVELPTPDVAYSERLERVMVLHLLAEIDPLFTDAHSIIVASKSRKEAMENLKEAEPPNAMRRVTQRMPVDDLTFDGLERQLVNMVRRLRDTQNHHAWSEDKREAQRGIKA